jgi:dTDP-4-dehydrorhamnose reductase
VRLLITGAGGVLGGRLAGLLARHFVVTAGVRTSAGPTGVPALSLEITDEHSLAAALDATRAEAVVHAATLNVDACETDPDLAERVNVVAGGMLARLCRQRGLRLVTFSTDLVFDGTRAPAFEHDLTLPLTVYGRTKRAGEQAVLQEYPDAAVIRSALVYGWGHGPRGSASETVGWALRAGKPARLFTDQYRTPIDAMSLADLVTRILERGASGIYHAGGPERLNRYELGQRTAQVLGLDPTALVPTTQSETPQTSPRPRDVSLDSSRARRELGWEPLELDVAIRDQRSEADA